MAHLADGIDPSAKQVASGARGLDAHVPRPAQIDLDGRWRRA
jgi:hypothetical protein